MALADSSNILVLALKKSKESRKAVVCRSALFVNEIKTCLHSLATRNVQYYKSSARLAHYILTYIFDFVFVFYTFKNAVSAFLSGTLKSFVSLICCLQDAGYGEKNMCASDDDNEEENQKIDDEV